jgi:hypothetical protein
VFDAETETRHTDRFERFEFRFLQRYPARTRT